MRILGKHATFPTAEGVRSLDDLALRARVARAEARDARQLAKTLDDELFATLQQMRAAGMKWEAIAARLREPNLTTLHNFYQRRSTGRRQPAEIGAS